MPDHKRLAKTPPLGWNSWDCFGAGVTEAQLRENADYMAKNLKAYGWEYIVCDIQWYEPKAVDNDYNAFTELSMDAYGRLLPAENRFPSAANGRGFAPIADYVHGLGLKFGLHMMRGVPRQAVAQNCPIWGTETTCREIAHPFSVCAWNTDMYGLKNCAAAQSYYDSVIELYASWGVDFIKCDDICVTEFRKWDEPYSAYYEIEMLRRAIDRCGRDIVLSLSPGPAVRDRARHLQAHANMWRLTGDFWDQWPKLYAMFDTCHVWEGVPKAGCWPDCDMLPIGVLSKNGVCGGPQNRKTQFTLSEQYTLMSLWGIFKSPLMIGGNLPEMDAFTLSLLTNAAYMRMHRECCDAKQLLRDERGGKGTIIWTANGKQCKYMAVFNTADKARKVQVFLDDVLMPDTAYTVYDIWQSRTLGTYKNRCPLTVDPHGARLLRIEA